MASLRKTQVKAKPKPVVGPKSKENGSRVKKARASGTGTNSSVDLSPDGYTSCDSVFKWFEAYVADNHVHVGDSLPSEDAIVQATGISRTSVREAMTRLRALGVIDTRRKRGMQLRRSPVLLELVRLLSGNTVPAELVPHMGSFRSALELGIESEIFNNATQADIDNLRFIYEKMLGSASDPNVWHDWDRRFHQTMIRITGNIVMIWLSELFEPYFNTLQRYTPQVMPDRATEKHRHLVDALEQRDQLAFHYAMLEHHADKLSLKHYSDITSGK